jgi:peptidyl-tRNA hydrolase, PTH1 family
VKLLVGLGNPGPEYADTRHNVGVRVLERLASAHRIPFEQHRFESRFGFGRLRTGGGEVDVALLAPLTFMNRSGSAVAAAVAGLGLAEPSGALLLVLDDVDLPFGRLRLRPAGGAGGHRGLADVIERLGTRELPRLRFGVGRPAGDRETADHVLERFSAEETARLPQHLGRAAAALETALVGGVVAAMTLFNRDPEAPEAGGG